MLKIQIIVTDKGEVYHEIVANDSLAIDLLALITYMDILQADFKSKVTLDFEDIIKWKKE